MYYFNTYNEAEETALTLQSYALESGESYTVIPIQNQWGVVQIIACIEPTDETYTAAKIVFQQNLMTARECYEKIDEMFLSSLSVKTLVKVKRALRVERQETKNKIEKLQGDIGTIETKLNQIDDLSRPVIEWESFTF